jgi:hypothetical protein
MGARRTGTTLVNQILCNDPKANPHVGECQLLTRLLGTFRWANNNYERVVQWYFDRPEDCAAYFVRLVEDFLTTAAAHFGGVEHLVLKNPEFINFKPELDRLLPESKHVVCIRDPRDQIVSELDVGRRQIEKGIDGNAARAFRDRDVRSLAGRYVGYYRNILEGRTENTSFVRYEDLIQRLGDTLAALGEFTGFDVSGFDPQAPWKRFEHKGEIMKMPAFVEQYGSPLDPSRVGRYRDALTADEQATVMGMCSELVTRFYPERP